MNSKKIIEQYYKAWINKDLKTLANLYKNDQKFNFDDPAFRNLNYDLTLKMWKMIFKNSSEPKLNATSEIIKVEGNNVWSSTVVKYEFGKDKNKVVNKIDAHFIVEDNKIIRQTETFDFPKWFSQAFNKEPKSNLFYFFVRKLMSKTLKKRIKKMG